MKWILLLLFLPSVSLAQGFSGLGSDAASFAVPERGTSLSFPRDHGPHPDFRIEWWYLTANLSAEDGTPYGLQWTLFRSALAPKDAAGWNSTQLWMGHAAVTTPFAHFVTERLARGGIGQAGVSIKDGFEAWIDEWHMHGTQDLNTLKMTANGIDFSYDMNLLAQGPLVLQGDGGFSVKSSAGQASYYYSQPFYEVEGILSLPEGNIAVTGDAWMDREWSSQPLAADQTGWNWFSLSFDGGARMMGFVLRSDGGADYTSSTWIDADGISLPMPNGAFQAKALEWSEVAQRKVPTTWALSLPDKGVELTVSALNTQAWMETSVPYWEGPISIEGSHSGRGYLEMTGY
ncbi:lipocalin-like domain-containing protein [Planktotalea sp.]|uniref:lipocalin-like domain-containing protein n=1 Tax=Planktotalea sp. TaxID=2029877 RepID=UPI0025E69A75|nr:lipocalin-like domain-containing protein [Planktotalea sp.]